MPTNYREYAKTFNFTFPEYGRGVGSDLALAAKARFRVFRVEYKFDPKYLHDLINSEPEQLEMFKIKEDFPSMKNIQFAPSVRVWLTRTPKPPAPTWWERLLQDDQDFS